MKKIEDLTNQEEEKKLPSSRFNIILEKQEVVQLTTVPGADPSDNLLWHSADEEIASVTNMGKVTAIEVGRTQIHVENETLTFEDLINVKVVGKGEARELRLAIQLKISEVVKLSLEDAEEPVWESLDSSVALVSETGEITGVSEGIALITATYGDDINVIYVIIKREDNNLNLADVEHYERIRNVIINNNGKVTQTTPTTFGNVGSGARKWVGGVLAPNGKIYGIPNNSPLVLELDPETKITSTFGNVGSGWTGGVLANNGKIYGIPGAARSILEIDPETRTTSTFGEIESSIGSGWTGGVLAQNGKIYGIPGAARSILEIDPETRTISTFGNVEIGELKWAGGVLASNGKIYGIPRNSSSVLEINTETKEVTTFGNLGSSIFKWTGGARALNGKIYGIPVNSSSVLEINTETKEITTFGNLGNGEHRWRSGVLAPNGKIYGIPHNTTTVLEIDPEKRTTRTFGNLAGTQKWYGGVLAPNGKIYGIPWVATTILEIDLGKELTNFGHTELLSAWINKF